ncbi:MAG: hypothetical protein C4K49_10535 [Candidatus Thorarchaeota archaeon]|nr:MAG: hypothetical protein C4K49_10535 [Candidatus Thorarchaeota archaeon]
MSVSYPNLYQRSILFEIINIKNPSEIVSAFTLTIPPDSIEITQGQRITRTKTFGGVFIDDYGLDVAKITISGTTGNGDLRATYIPGKSGALEQYSGKDAIYAFRDKIARYKNLLVGKGFESYEMRMYDFSTVPDTTALDTVQNSTTDGWVVSLDDFKISRSKDRPLWYNYSIELVGLYPLPTPRSKVADEMDPIVSPTGDTDLATLSNEVNQGLATVKVPTAKDWLQDAIYGMRRCINAVKAAYSWSANLLNKIDNVFATLDDLEELCLEYIDATGNLVTEASGLYSKIFEVAEFPGAAAVTAMSTTNEVMQEIEDEIEDSTAITETLGNNYDYVVQLCEETKRIAARIVNFGKSQVVDTEVTVQVNGQNVTIYGTISITADSAVTLDKLAAQYYGDPSLAMLIAVYNGLTNNDVVAGVVIRIPQTVRSNLVLDNKIYSWDRLSNYGTDILLASSSQGAKLVIAESGDFSYVSGKDNLLQAINLRLNEQLGKRLRLTVYGLSVAIGSPRTNTAPIEYILSNLRDTLKQDPRVKSIDNIKLNGVGDSLYVAFNVQAISDSISYEGVL